MRTDEVVTRLRALAQEFEDAAAGYAYMVTSFAKEGNEPGAYGCAKSAAHLALQSMAVRKALDIFTHQDVYL